MRASDRNLFSYLCSVVSEWHSKTSLENRTNRRPAPDPSKKPPFQTVVDLYLAPSMGDLKRALCYEVQGKDMEVSGFEVKSWKSFKR